MRGRSRFGTCSVAKRIFRVSIANPNWHKVVGGVKAQIEYMVESGHDVEVEVRDPRRTSPENRLLHALIGELARKLEWAGAKRSDEVWKRLLVSAWCRANGASVEILPALDGHGVDIVPVRTSRLSKRDCAELIEYVLWFGTDQGIKWDEHREVG